jgi:hypothetical protein
VFVGITKRRSKIPRSQDPGSDSLGAQDSVFLGIFRTFGREKMSGGDVHNRKSRLGSGMAPKISGMPREMWIEY